MALATEVQNLHKEFRQPSVTIASVSTLQSLMYLSFHHLSEGEKVYYLHFTERLVPMKYFPFMGVLSLFFSCAEK